MSGVIADTALAASAQDAGGAPAWQLAVLGLVYWGGTGGLMLLLHAHRTGRTRVLERAAAAAGWVFRLPGWAALPVTVSVVGLLVAMWAGVWDIGYHVDNGRDSGPLGNPGHLPLLLGLFLTFAGGILAAGLADQADASPAWVRLRGGWRVPLGAVLLAGCMAFGMAALALDDIWHRVYGQDVTLWSPTHFIYLCGGVLTVLGMLVLLKEGSNARARQRAADAGGEPPARGEPDYAQRVGRAWARIQRAALLGGLLCGLELFLTEFDYGVPLYRQVWQPLLLAAFSGFVLTAARAWVGRGGALGAVSVYLAIRLTAIAVPALAGVSPSSMPPFLVEALCVELLALRLAPRGRPLAFGAVAGLLCGTVGFAGEYAWSQIAFPLPWTAALWPEGAILAALGGLAAGVLGALLAGALRGDLPRPRVARSACVASFALLLALGVDAGIRHVPDARAHVTLSEISASPDREAVVTARIDPPVAADDANWLYVLAWQGRAPRVVDRLDRVGPGVYRTNGPIPLGGSWKVGLRLNQGYARGSVPVRLPADGALSGAERPSPATVGTRAEFSRTMRRAAGAELPAPESFTRPFVDDSLIVLRETKGDVAGWVWALGIGLTALLWGGFVVAVALGLGRMARHGRSPLRRADANRSPAA
jgi:hypothetical protein